MTTTIQLTPRQTRKVLLAHARRLNGIIHRENLYAGHSRFINAQVRADAGGDYYLAVENLQTGALHVYKDDQFRTGYGTPVNIFRDSLN